jgi:hypothetical protein
MPRGYELKVEDSKGNEKKFFSSNATTHKQGSALANALLTHLNSRYATYGPFSTRTVQPGNGGVGFTDIGTRIDRVTWP